MAKWVTDTATRYERYKDTNRLTRARISVGFVSPLPASQSSTQILGQTRALYQLIKYLVDTFFALVAVTHVQLISSRCLLFAVDRKVFGKCILH